MLARSRLALAGLALGAVIAFAYANAFNAELVLDGRHLIEGDPRVQSTHPEAVQFIFTRDYWWPQRASDLYRPVTTLSFWLNYSVFGHGADPTGYHVVNFLLHWANTVLVLLLAVRLAGRADVALVAAALFAVHPIATEAVTNIAGRADLLAACGVLGSALCYVRASEPGRGRIAWLAASGAFALLGMLSKESAVVIVGFIALYDGLYVWPSIAGDGLGKRFMTLIRQGALRWGAVAAALAVFAVARAAVTGDSLLVGQPFVDNPLVGASWGAGFLTACKVFGKGLALLAFPVSLSSDYSYNQIPVYGASASLFENAKAWLGVASILALSGAAWRFRRVLPALSWALLWLFVARLPTSDFVIRIGSIFGERFLYLPSVGFAVAVATLAGPMLAGAGQRVVLARGAVAAVVLAFGARTFLRNQVWRDELSLWTRALDTAPNSFRSHAGYANALLMRDRTEPTVDSAIAHAERALAILDNPPLPIEHRENGVLLNLGVDYRLKAQHLRARGDSVAATDYLRRSVAAFERAREVDQWYTAAVRDLRVERGGRLEAAGDVGNAGLYVELGESLIELREWPQALEAARYAQRLGPDVARAYIVDGIASYYSQRPRDAAVAFAIALIIEPETGVWGHLESAYNAVGAKAPIVQQGAMARFAVGTEHATELLTTAGNRLVAAFEAAGRRDDAQALREQLASAYSLDLKPPATR